MIDLESSDLQTYNNRTNASVPLGPHLTQTSTLLYYYSYTYINKCYIMCTHLLTNSYST